jgi:hypothetical protein
MEKKKYFMMLVVALAFTLVFNGCGTQTFPIVGIWHAVASNNSGSEWTAELVINKINGKKFYGYFDWVSNRDQRGHENYEGIYDTITGKITFKRLSEKNSNGDGVYVAYLSRDNKNIERGIYQQGTWSAKWYR